MDEFNFPDTPMVPQRGNRVICYWEIERFTSIGKWMVEIQPIQVYYFKGQEEWNFY
jgi:hypothetical protein